MHLDTVAPASRRRGAALEDALLSSAWQELVKRGYGALTFDSVAHSAGTSRPVITRRWATKPELVRAAVAHELLRHVIEVPDTGSLRDDTVALLREANEKRIAITALITSYLGDYFLETGSTPADLRASIVGERQSSVDTIVDRAVARGEVRADRLTPRTRTLAFDLFRHEALMRLGRVPDDVIDEIVDDIYVPVLCG
ncbi:TetR/AcrR family transcriptional regulator [Cellulomonas sp. URHE0023]|uniref:TetR/AcrR family transcriptional regulator n=1 Tax=Cellulomonas sp. URHE0023 TaxID=1380354 RepID=UPI00047F8285|nr:TetR/AcrR family transcriptional regulator [Cellulomonas sp. URHE0023]